MNKLNLYTQNALIETIQAPSGEVQFCLSLNLTIFSLELNLVIAEVLEEDAHHKSINIAVAWNCFYFVS